MTQPPPRRFTIADAMILTVAGAVGSLLVRQLWPQYLRDSTDPWSLIPVLARYFGVLQAADLLGSCGVIPLMAAQVVLRLRSPCPQSIRDEPGFVASLATLGMMAVGLGRASRDLIDADPFAEDLLGNIWENAASNATTASIGAWVALILSLRWRPRADWVDRLGRVLGWFWVVLFVGWEVGQTVQRALAVWGSQ